MCTMSASVEQACMLCHREDADPDICGSTVERNGICAHEFCLRFAKKLCEQMSETEGLVFFVADVRCMIEQAAQKHCFVCGESGASITCWEMDCDRSFHLPCAVEGECVTQFFAPYRAFCWEHRPQQAVEETPEDNTICLICLDPVGDRKSYSTLVCPACKHAWFHRGCIQGQAMSNGFTCFQCLICRDKDVFRPEMCTMGIRIPFSLPSWDSQAFAELNERHSRCDAWECFCLGGREQVEEEGPWQLLLCISCAAEGTHRFCSNLTNNTTSWECDSCAGLGTASSAILELSGPSTSSQEVPGASHSFPALGSSGRSRSPGPVRMRDHSRSQRSAQNPYSRPRQRRT